MQDRAGGIFQLSGSRDVSYADIGRFLAANIGVEPGLVHETNAREAGLPEGATPLHTTLDSSLLRAHYGFAVPDVWEVVARIATKITEHDCRTHSKMSQYSRTCKTCRLCLSSALDLVVPLKPIAIATPNVDLQAVAERHAGVAQVSASLDLYLCGQCGHLQLLDVIDPDIQYTHFKYTTSRSLGLVEHFRKLADELITLTATKPDSLVIEIGSNDGTLLQRFKEHGLNVLGIDPAQKTAQRATASGILTLADFFTSKLAGEIAQKHGRAAIVIANNTLANIDDLVDMAVGIERLLAPGGVFVFETSYGADVVEKFLLDTVYHEHLSYFMVRPLIAFFRRYGLELYDVQHISPKGGSLRGFVKLTEDPRPIAPSVAAMAERERSLGLDDLTPYRKFAAHIDYIRTEVDRIVADCRHNGYKIAGYGASVGTVTLLQQFGLGAALDFIVDDDPLTDVIIGSDYRIPVLPPAALDERKPSLVMILAPRYAELIRQKNMRYLQNGGRFLVLQPEVRFL
jgi:SAM-dependent methyltransferase